MAEIRKNVKNIFSKVGFYSKNYCKPIIQWTSPTAPPALEYSQKLGGILKLSGNRIVRTRLICGVGRGEENFPLPD
jgi:hypothetical protein